MIKLTLLILMKNVNQEKDVFSVTHENFFLHNISMLVIYNVIFYTNAWNKWIKKSIFRWSKGNPEVKSSITIEGVSGKKPQVTSDTLLNSPSKLTCIS